MSLTISLPIELENRVRQHVASGMYGSASEVIREALHLFESYQTVQAANVAALKHDIEQGLADVDAGRVATLDIDAVKTAGRHAIKGKSSN